MKKIIFTFCISLLALCGCVNGNNITTLEETNLDGYVNLNDEQKNIFKEIDVDSLNDIFKNNKKAVVYIGYAGCHFCQSAVVDMSNVALKNNLTIYYLDATKIIETETEHKRVLELLDPILTAPSLDEPKQIYCPLTIRISKGEIRGAFTGYREDLDMVSEYTEIMLEGGSK